MMKRNHDIEPLPHETLTVFVNDEAVQAAPGETVLSLLFAHGMRAISDNDYGARNGAFCGMGVCFSCTLNVDGLERQRACQVTVRDGMRIMTNSNRLQELAV